MGFLNSLFSENSGASFDKKLIKAIDKLDASLNGAANKVEKSVTTLENAGQKIAKASDKTTRVIDVTDDVSQKAVND